MVFGGEGADDLGDLWTYDVRSLRWEELKIDGNGPCARRFHSSCLVDNKMYIFGGCHSKYICLNDLYSLNLTSLLEEGLADDLRWEKVKLNGEITERWGHSSHYYKGEIFVFGGRASEDMNDLVAINVENGEARKVPTYHEPAARRRHGGGFIGSALVLFGGFDGNYFDDSFYINLYQRQNRLTSKNYQGKEVILKNGE